MEIAKQLFSELVIEPQGTWWDEAGIDGFLSDEPVQIKFDGRIASSGNIYHEVYEKTANHPEQPWRVAFGKVTYYIFTTETPIEIIAIKISIDALAQAEVGKTLQCLRPNYGDPTSLGFLVSYDELKHQSELRRQFRPIRGGYKSPR